VAFRGVDFRVALVRVVFFATFAAIVSAVGETSLLGTRPPADYFSSAAAHIVLIGIGADGMLEVEDRPGSRHKPERRTQRTNSANER
jgi:hypothetical protein